MKVPIRNLAVGLHEIDFGEIDANLLNIHESHFYPNKLRVHVVIDRFDQAYRFKISVKTKAIYQCDRCLEKFEVNFDESIEQIYEVGNGEIAIDDEVTVISGNDNEIDISAPIQEVFLLSRPFKLLCRDNCKGLCPQCGTNLNLELCNCKKESVDPRLEKLRTLLN